MRAEDKELEGYDLEHEEQRERGLAGEDELREVAGEEVVDVHEAAAERETERQKLVVGAIRALFEQRNVTVSQLALPDHETRALASLQSALTGRQQTGEFVFAEDRRDLLEQALAILQPNLTNASPELLAELGSMEKLTDKLANLRSRLDRLEDAQEVIPEWEKQEWFGAAEGGDTDDQNDQGDKGDQPVAGEPEQVGAKPSTLSEGKAVERVAAPSTLADGPAVERAPVPSTLADGPTVERAPAPSTLADGPAIERAPVPSTLSDGDPVGERGAARSSLGDVEEPPALGGRIGSRIANAAKAAVEKLGKKKDKRER